MNVLHYDWVSLTRVIFHYFRVYCIFLFINILEQKGQQHFASTTGSKVSLTWKEHLVKLECQIANKTRMTEQEPFNSM